MNFILKGILPIWNLLYQFSYFVSCWFSNYKYALWLLIIWQVPADKLTVGALSGVQSLLELAESSTHKGFVMDVYRHLIFNFYIWSRADYNVQSGKRCV